MGKTMNQTIAAWLPEVLTDRVTVAPDDLMSEARENQWSFSVTCDEASTISVGDIQDFISAVVQARKEALTNDGRPVGSMRFYCWFDAMACQLRFSIVSAKGDALPFGCAIVNAELPSIARAFLQAGHHDGIPWAEFSPGATGCTASPKPPLDVWSSPIP